MIIINGNRHCHCFVARTNMLSKHKQPMLVAFELNSFFLLRSSKTEKSLFHGLNQYTPNKYAMKWKCGHTKHKTQNKIKINGIQQIYNKINITNVLKWNKMKFNRKFKVFRIDTVVFNYITHIAKSFKAITMNNFPQKNFFFPIASQFVSLKFQSKQIDVKFYFSHSKQHNRLVFHFILFE